MTLDLTKEQYAALLKLTYLGGAVAAYAEEKLGAELELVESTIYAHAADFGLGQLIEYDKEEESFFPSETLEHDMLVILDEFKNESFWDKLAQELALRDLIKQHGEETVEEMEDEAYAKLEDPLYEKYFDEFEKCGIDNLTLSK